MILKLYKFILIVPALFISLIGPLAFANDTSQTTQTYISFEQRVAISYFILGADETQEKKDEIFERLKTFADNYVSAPEKKVNVKDFSEFLTHYKGEWPNSHSLDSDLRIIEKRAAQGQMVRTVLYSENEQLQAEIEKYQERQQAEISNRFGQIQSSENLASILALSFLSGTLSESDAKEVLNQGFEKSAEIIKQEFEKLQNSTANITSQSLSNGKDEAIKIFMTVVLKKYFGHLSLNSKKQIVSALLGEKSELTEIEKFELMVQNSGPQFQKLLQVIARESGVSPEILAVFKKLESRVKPVPAVLVKEMFEKEREVYNWLNYEVKPLGVGTMAQVHKGLIKTKTGVRPVVIRFLKPGIAERVQEDRNILSLLAPEIDSNETLIRSGFPKMTPLVEDLTKTVSEELEMQRTIEQQQVGRNVYKREGYFVSSNYKNALNIVVPEVVVADRDSVLMVQELVRGSKLDAMYSKYGQTIPDLKKVVVENIAKVWLDEVLFRSGFFHSDLHQGNFLVDIKEQAITVSILDFGMGGYLSREMQKAVSLLAAGIEINNAKVISQALWKLSRPQENQIAIEDFERLVEEKVSALILTHQISSIDKWSAWAINSGLRFPGEFIGLNRGNVILEKLLADSGSSLTMAKIGKNLGVYYPKRLMFDLLTSGAFKIRDLLQLGYVVAAKVNDKKTNSNLADLETVESSRSKITIPGDAPTLRSSSPSVRCEKVFLLNILVPHGAQ